MKKAMHSEGMGTCDFSVGRPRPRGSTSCFCQDTDTERQRRRKRGKEAGTVAVRGKKRERMTSNEVTVTGLRGKARNPGNMQQGIAPLNPLTLEYLTG